MTIKRLGTYTCHFLHDEHDEQFPTLLLARARAEQFVGNRSCAKPFPGEDTYLYGPGDGTTSVMIRQDIDFED